MSYWQTSVGDTLGTLSLKVPDAQLADYLFRESGTLQQLIHTESALKVANDPKSKRVQGTVVLTLPQQGSTLGMPTL
jgi:hypothetical protein